MAYLRYRWLMRLIWPRIAPPTGREASAPDAYEYTDWDAVTRFATACATSARSAQHARPATSQPQRREESRPLDLTKASGT
jgi:hypothetical protein